MPGRIRTEDVEELRQRADLVEVISGHTNLKKTGRIFRGLCCFHQEKTPSFTVDPDRGLYHCFGCGVGGDVFTFVREIDGLSFTEAAERLASRYGVTLRYEGGESRESHSKKALFAAVREAADFFAKLLHDSGEAEGARRYLTERGFSQEDAKSWGLGYSPPARDTLYRHLLSRKFTAKQIEEAGLARASESGQYVDRFRGRLMFPISEITGELIGFGARALGTEQPKYLNSPDTPLYHKAKVLFGLDRARRHLATSGRAVVTEGYTDVLALQKVGVEGAVATCGTALGDAHLEALKRFCDRIVLAFDADAAGAVASERAFGLHSKLGLEVLVAPIPDGKDPADVALTEGQDTVETILSDSVPLMRFVLEAEIARHKLDTPEGKGKAVRAAAQLLSWEPNRVARGEHAFWVARRIGVEASEVQREVAEIGTGDRAGGSTPRVLRLPGHVKVEREALTLLLGTRRDLIAEITEEHFTRGEHRAIYLALVDSRAGKPGGQNQDEASMMDRLPDRETRRLAAELALDSLTTGDADEVMSRLEEFRIRRKIDSLRNTLDQFDPASEHYRKLFEELMRLEEERRRKSDEG
jgi:DNA primase